MQTKIGKHRRSVVIAILREVFIGTQVLHFYYMQTRIRLIVLATALAPGVLPDLRCEALVPNPY